MLRSARLGAMRWKGWMDMWRIAGACLVALASAMAGWAARQGMHGRVRIRRQLRLALELMQGEMELGMPTVAELFETVGKQMEGEVGRFLEDAALEMSAVSGRPPRTALKIEMERQPGLFDTEERMLLLELGGCLGRYDLEGQARALTLYKDRADRLTASSEEMLRRRARASMTASVCAGLALIIILL